MIVTDRRINFLDKVRCIRRQALKNKLRDLRKEDKKSFSGLAWKSVKHRINKNAIKGLAGKVEAMTSLMNYFRDEAKSRISNEQNADTKA